MNLNFWKNRKDNLHDDKEVEKQFKNIFSEYLNTGSNLKVELKDITKIYSNGIMAVNKLNLEIKKGEFVVLLGPSGCGKTTILRMIAGLESISNGYLKFNNVIFNSTQPKDRKISMVFQNYALYPFMNVFQNISYGLKNKTRNNEVYKEYTRKIKVARNSNYQKILDLKAKKAILKDSASAETKDKILNLKRDLKYYKFSKSKTKDEQNVLSSEIKTLQDSIKNHKKDQKVLDEIEKINNEIKQLKSTKTSDKQKINELLAERSNSVRIWKNYIPVNINSITKMLGISQYLKRKPAELSGGQRQRVALARAISKKVNLYLYDEPLSNLDAKLRAKMRTEIKKIHNELGSTSVYVTHDQVEAMSMADKIVVMHKGYIQQFGTPLELINNPNNLFVANFIGNTNLNMFDATYENKTTFSLNKKHKVQIANRPEFKKEKFVGKNIVVAFRPEHVITDKTIVRQMKDNKFAGKVVFKEMLGNDVQLTLDVKDLGEVNVLASIHQNFQIGEQVEFVINMNKINLFDRENGFNLLIKLDDINKKAKDIWIEGEQERIKNNTLVHIQSHKLSWTEWIKFSIYSIFSKRARKTLELARDKTASKENEKIAK